LETVQMLLTKKTIIALLALFSIFSNCTPVIRKIEIHNKEHIDI
jgi:hypothetical protein